MGILHAIKDKEALQPTLISCMELCILSLAKTQYLADLHLVKANLTLNWPIDPIILQIESHEGDRVVTEDKPDHMTDAATLKVTGHEG